MTEQTDPILASLWANAAKKASQTARLFGIPEPAPDAEGERTKPIEQEDTEDE